MNYHDCIKKETCNFHRILAQGISAFQCQCAWYLMQTPDRPRHPTLLSDGHKEMQLQFWFLVWMEPSTQLAVPLSQRRSHLSNNGTEEYEAEAGLC